MHQRGTAKRKKQHRDLRIGTGGKKQYQNHKDYHEHGNDTHFFINELRGNIPQGCTQIVVIGCKIRVHLVQGGLTTLVRLRVCKCNAKQCGSIIVMCRRLIQIDGKDAFHRLQILLNLQRLIIGNIGHHHLRGTVGQKLFLHEIKPLRRLGCFRQIFRQPVFHLDPIPGNNGKNAKQCIDQKEQIAFIYNKRTDL